MESIEKNLTIISERLSAPADKLLAIYYQVKIKDLMNSDDHRQLTDFGVPFTQALASLNNIDIQSAYVMIYDGKINLDMFKAVVDHIACLENPICNQNTPQFDEYSSMVQEWIIDAYNAGYEECENKGMREYSAEQYFNETFSSHLKEKS